MSSRAQDAKSQRSAIERAASARSDTIEHWYSEKRSAKTTDREALCQLRADARAGHIRRLYLFRLDRLTRSGIRDTLELVAELRDHGVEIITIADGFDLNGPAAEIVLAVLSWASQMERLAINERISAARERLASEGRPWGRPKRLDGAVVSRIEEMRQAGRSIREIAVAMKIPRSTVARALRPSQKHGADHESENAPDSAIG